MEPVETDFVVVAPSTVTFTELDVRAQVMVCHALSARLRELETAPWADDPRKLQ